MVLKFVFSVFAEYSDLNTAADVRFDPNGFHTSSALLAVSGRFSAITFWPAMSDAVVLPFDCAVPLSARFAHAVQKLLMALPADRFQSLHGKHVVTANGARIGTVHDLVADELTGNVVALEITTDGRRNPGARLSLLHTRGNIALTNDIVVIPQDVVATRSK